MERIGRSVILAVLAVMMTFAVSEQAAWANVNDRIPVRLLELNPIPDWSSSFMLLGEALGVYEKHGLDAKVIFSGGGGPSKIQALLAGEADIALSDIIATLSAVYEGADIVGIMVPSARYGAAVVAADNIERVQDMRGRQWGIPSVGGSARFLSMLVLEAFGMTERDVRWLAVGGATDAVPALDSGRVDAITVVPSVPIHLKDWQGSRNLHILIPNTAVYTPPFPNFTFNVRRSTLENNPELVERFLRAQLEMARIFQEDLDTYMDVIPKVMPDAESLDQDGVKAVALSMQQTGYWAVNGGVNLEAIQRVMDLYLQIRGDQPNQYLRTAADAVDTTILRRVLDDVGVVESEFDRPDWR